MSDIEAAWQHNGQREVLDEESRRWAEAYLERAATERDMGQESWTQAGPLDPDSQDGTREHDLRCGDPNPQMEGPAR